MELNDVYENVRSQLLHREKLLSLEESIDAIRQAESHLRVSSEPQGHNSTALLTKKPEIRATSTRNWTSRPSPPSLIQGLEGDDNKDLLFCTYCKKRRHTKENCWKKIASAVVAKKNLSWRLINELSPGNEIPASPATYIFFSSPVFP